MIITITGMPCSGKSSIAKYLAEHYDFDIINAGQLFREEAKSRGMTLYELTEICNTDDSVDRVLDSKIADLGRQRDGTRTIFDSRMAWHFVPNSFKVFVSLDEDEMAKRLYLSDRSVAEKGETPEQARDGLLRRWQSENYRYKTLYGVCNSEPEHFDFVVSSRDKTVAEVAEEIYQKYLEYAGE